MVLGGIGSAIVVFFETAGVAPSGSSSAPMERSSRGRPVGSETVVKMIYYVYLLRSQRDGKYYIGHSENIKRRLAEHNSGRVKATRYRRPFVVVGYEAHQSRDDARWRETEVKRSAHKRYTFIENCNKSRRGSVVEQGTHKP